MATMCMTPRLYPRGCGAVALCWCWPRWRSWLTLSIIMVQCHIVVLDVSCGALARVGGALALAGRLRYLYIAMAIRWAMWQQQASTSTLNNARQGKSASPQVDFKLHARVM